MIPNALAFGLLGGIVGFFSKAALDFYVATKKDGFRDHKNLISELLKSIETLTDQVDKEIFEAYTKRSATPAERSHRVAKIENSLKNLGVQVNRLNQYISQNTAIKSCFNNEVMEFRKEATLEIHDAEIDGFDTVGTLSKIHTKLISLNGALSQTKMNLAIYQLPEHIAYACRDHKFLNFLSKRWQR